MRNSSNIFAIILAFCTLFLISCDKDEAIQEDFLNQASNSSMLRKAGNAADGSINISVFLEGAYNNTTKTMYTTLNRNSRSNKGRGLLPGQKPLSPLTQPTPAGQPYNVAPWFYEGTEGSDKLTYSPTVVYWVLVSLLDANLSDDMVLWQAAALLHESGRIEFFDTPDFHAMPRKFNLKVEHRNHLPVRSPKPIQNTGRIDFDFSKADSYTNASSGQKEMPNGFWVMFAGDADKVSTYPRYSIDLSDRIEWSLLNGTFDRYTNADMNMDGDINFLDKNLWAINNGISSGI